MGIETSVSDDGSVLNFDMGNSFGMEEFADFREAYSQEVTGVSEVIVDLSGIEYLDSASLGMLLHMRQSLHKNNIDKFVLKNSTPELVRLFQMSKFDKYFMIR